MMRKIRIGVAGLGRIGWLTHCKLIASQPTRYKLVAVADPVAERRKEAEAVYGCKAFACYDDMIAMDSLEAVVIASPTHLHLAQAVSAFKHGHHVYLEKPMACDYGEARKIVQAAKQAKRVLSIYQPHRAAAYYQHVKKVLASGRIGEVYHVRRGLFNYTIRDDWQAMRKFGGGMLANYGAHALDQLLDVTGRDVKRVFCQTRLVANCGRCE